MKDNVSFVLAFAVVGLVTFALIEKSKWINSKTSSKTLAAGASKEAQGKTKSEGLKAVEKNVSSSSNGSHPETASTQSNSEVVDANIEIETIWIWVAVTDPAQPELKKMTTELEGNLVKSRRNQLNKTSKSQLYAYRFVTQPKDVADSSKLQYKLTARLEKPSADKWNLAFDLGTNSPSSKRETTSEKRQFPLANPLPNHKMVYTDSSIAAQMSGFLIDVIQRQYEIDSSKKKLDRPF